MSENALGEILAKLTSLDAKVDTLGKGVDTLGARVDQLDIAQTKMRVGIMGRIDELSDQVRFMRDDIETTFNTADRSGRIDQDHIRSLDEQLASMVRQQRLLDSRL